MSVEIQTRQSTGRVHVLGTGACILLTRSKLCKLFNCLMISLAALQCPNQGAFVLFMAFQSLSLHYVQGVDCQHRSPN